MPSSRNPPDSETVPASCAIIGAGAVSQVFHLPALVDAADVHVTHVVDADLERARAAAAKFGVPNFASDLEAAIGHVDVAIVALPNHLHETISTRLLAAGVHVLV